MESRRRGGGSGSVSVPIAPRGFDPSQVGRWSLRSQRPHQPRRRDPPHL